MRKLVFMASLLFFTASSPENFVALGNAGILRFPAANKTNIVFVYAGDLWIIARNGGAATRLTNSPGTKSYPRFSPDGQRIAFTGAYNGVYTIPVAGGQANRLTHNPGNTTVCSWTPDGRVLFMTDSFNNIFDGDGQARVRQLFTVGANGGLPQKLPVPYGANGAINADGEWLAYTPYAEGLTEKRKHYFGGFAPDIWLFNLRDHRARQITDWKGADTSPMWFGTTVYYLSDGGAEARMNIWSYDTKTNTRRQVTHFTDFDIKWPSIGPGANGQGEIVFNYGTDLYLLDLANNKSRKVEVSLPRDLAPETLSVDAGKFVVNWNMSAEGERAVVEARGDVWTVAADGAKRRLTSNSSAAERDPSWSPNGRWIAFFSDASGEYELYVVAADDSAAPRQLTHIGAGFRYRPVWSPDSRHVAFYDSSGSIYLHTIESGETKKIDRDPLVSKPQMSWSPNSRWLAYARGAEGSLRYTAIWLYSLDDKRTHQVTSGSFNDSWPVFDRAGDYLFFVSTRNFNPPTFDPVDYNNFIYPGPDVVLVTPLRSDVGLPWSPAAQKAGEFGRVELQNFEYRAQAAVRDQGRYSNLAVGSDGQLIFSFTGRDGKTSIRLVNFKEGREVKTILEGFQDFQLSSDGKKLALRQDNNLMLVDPIPNQKPTPRIKFENMKVAINSRAEALQIFQDAWRLYRDNFYDVKMRGVDWPAMRIKYTRLLDACARREDFYEVIGEMLGELGSSHLFLFPPADEQPEPEQTGTIGVEFEIDRGAYRVAKIFDGAANDPFLRNYLRRGAANVKEGEYLLAVNGTALDTKQDPWLAFKGLAGKTATLTISSKPALDQAARQVTVLTGSWSIETVFRNSSWVEANRAYVERRTNGKVGYIYLANTHDWGSKEFTRQLNFQLDKQALIIDGRWNEGGHLPLHIIEVLGRQRYLYHYFFNRSAGGRTPDFLHEGPLCLLTNGVAYSGGDELAYFFRKRGLGKIIGTRTMGGMIGAGGLDIRFVDGGWSLVPIVGFYDETGKWVIEGYGVEPDIKVIDDPAQMLDGADPQLDKAIETMLKALKGPKTIPRVP